MNYLNFKSTIKSLIENNNSTFASEAKSYCNQNLEEVGKITSDCVGHEGDNIVKIFKLEDGYLVIVDNPEIDYCYFEQQLDEAQKLATEKASI